MKQTKKLTRSQREFLIDKGVKNPSLYRLVEETNTYMRVQNVQIGNIKEFTK